MPRQNEQSTTLPEPVGDISSERAHPCLLFIGAAGHASHPPPRLLRLPDVLSIGRGAGERGGDPAHLGLSDRALSRNHLRIIRKAGAVEVEDAGSLNGTFLDGRRLSARSRLSEGSILFLGGHAAVFRRVPESALPALEREVSSPFGPVATQSPAMAVTLDILRRLSDTESELLLGGETGVGKEVCARAIHDASGRTGRFVPINCTAIPIELAESELFGYARGAHSTATEAKAGLVTTADGGTLFLDEIGDMNPRVQTKLLRFLQDHEVIPVGATRGRTVDVRIIAATSRVGSGTGSPLRADLLARLGAEPVHIPPLRERIEDLGGLLRHFLKEAGPNLLQTEAFRALCLYGFPRNVRELQKIVVRAAALTEDGEIRIDHLPASVRAALRVGPPIAVRRRPRGALSRAELEAVLAEHQGNVTAVARALDRQWNVVWRWVVKYGLSPKRSRPAKNGP